MSDDPQRAPLNTRDESGGPELAVESGGATEKEEQERGVPCVRFIIEVLIPVPVWEDMVSSDAEREADHIRRFAERTGQIAAERIKPLLENARGGPAPAAPEPKRPTTFGDGAAPA